MPTDNEILQRRIDEGVVLNGQTYKKAMQNWEVAKFAISEHRDAQDQAAMEESQKLGLQFLERAVIGIDQLSRTERRFERLASIFYEAALLPEDMAKDLRTDVAKRIINDLDLCQQGQRYHYAVKVAQSGLLEGSLQMHAFEEAANAIPLIQKRDQRHRAADRLFRMLPEGSALHDRVLAIKLENVPK